MNVSRNGSSQLIVFAHVALPLSPFPSILISFPLQVPGRDETDAIRPGPGDEGQPFQNYGKCEEDQSFSVSKFTYNDSFLNLFSYLLSCILLIKRNMGGGTLDGCIHL